MKTYRINWIAKVSGLASVEAESEAEAISQFMDECIEYEKYQCNVVEDDSPYEYGHKVDNIEEEEDEEDE